ncbi:MFS transporter [Microbacterium sp. TPD7012]|uniref:MFS transporter n=1 Tax=Microbacterium sp. TPD7012 TaxID=2171975 RepID=UPI000D516C86|nr:MFS transporter [Microbacterium sp. TPD7012]PVE98183.1 MFS transporter [Microbacterium sp. TPD7012]
MTLVLIATFGGAVSALVPMAFSLALRIDQLTPGQPELLGFVLASSAAAALLTAPLSGMLSDRTRSRWGRRRPFTLGGVVVGIAAVPALILADDVLTLALAWVVCAVGFGTASSSVRNFQADYLAPAQRGKVVGLASLTTQVAPVLGILLAGTLVQNVAFLFAVPASLGAACLLVFVVLVPEPSSRDRVVERPLSLTGIIRSYGFSPRRQPDFAWLWLGRFVVFSGLTMTTSYTTFFYAQRLDLSVAEVAAILAVTSMLSIVSLGTGSLGSGWLSDRLGRRRPFVAIGGLTSACGCILSATATDLPLLLTGSFMMSLGVAMFTTASAAIGLDVLPERDAQAGRFMAITMFAQRIPAVIVPLISPALLAVPGGPESGNFAVLYITAGLLLACGSGTIAVMVRGVR